MASERIGHYTGRAPIGQGGKRRGRGAFSRAMSRLRTLTATLWIAALAAAAAGQVARTVKGSREDLRGARTVYVDASYDREVRDALVAAIKTELPELTIAEAPEGADLVVIFSRSVADERRGGADISDEPPFSADQKISRTSPPRAPRLPAARDMGDEPDAPDPFERPSRYGIGSVVKPAPPGPSREILTFKQPIRTKVEATARDFVRKLAKEYRKANAK